jgi:hypothetical protein
MEYDIQERRQYIAKHYPGGPRYTMEIEAAEYTEAMNAAIEAAARRLSKGASPSAAISSDLDHKPSPEKISA